MKRREFISLGLFPSPRKAAAAITVTRPWVAQNTAWTDPNAVNGHSA